MIPVAMQPEPAGYDANVRRPGKTFLTKFPNPTGKDFKGHTYWKWAGDELHAAYRGICAYTCFYLVPPGSIDHFRPKSTTANLAYEWSNLRLASYRVNTYKGSIENILDPFQIQANWFVMDMPSCLLKPADGLAADLAQAIEQTIVALHLNSDDTFVQERCDMMYAYAQGEVTLNFLQRRFPFLAAEIQRQGIQGTANAIFRPLVK